MFIMLWFNCRKVKGHDNVEGIMGSCNFELVGLAEFSFWGICVFSPWKCGRTIRFSDFQASKEKHWWWSMCRLLQAGPVTTQHVSRACVHQSETHSNMWWVLGETHCMIVICLCIFFLIIEKLYLSNTYSCYEKLWLFRMSKSKSILIAFFQKALVVKEIQIAQSPLKLYKNVD